MEQKRIGKRAKAHRNKDGDKSSTDWWIVAFTGMLTVLGLLQYLAMRKQAHYMRDGLQETKRAADAAKDSAAAASKAIVQAEKTTHVTQRAVVLLEDVVAVPQGGENECYLQPNSLLVFTLKNYGATVAYKVKVEGKIRFGEKIIRLFGDPGATMAPQGSHKWITASLVPQLAVEEVEEASSGNNLLTYVVDVTYEDAFEKPHTYRATGSYIAPLRGFVTGGSTSD